MENCTLIEIQVAAAEAYKQEILLSPFLDGIEALASRARTLTALDQIIISALVKRPLSATEEHAERTLAEEHRTQETCIRELQQKDPPPLHDTGHGLSASGDTRLAAASHSSRSSALLSSARREISISEGEDLNSGVQSQ
jgi:hypothetical protein